MAGGAQLGKLQLLHTHNFFSPRYSTRDCRARVSSLYLPLVTIAVDNLDKLFSWSAEGEVRAGKRWAVPKKDI